MAEYDEALKEKIDASASEFAKSLEAMAGLCEKRFSKIVRKGVLDLFANIVRRSPVDTGAYRASHSIANHDPGPDEGIVQVSQKISQGQATRVALENRAWTWEPGDGTIYIFNNLPYAEALEKGHSSQAPEGIYYQALTEANAILQKAKLAIDVEGIFK